MQVIGSHAIEREDLLLQRTQQAKYFQNKGF